MPESIGGGGPAALPPPPTEFNFYFGQDYFALPAPPQLWVIDDLLPAGGVVNLYGPPKSHKSFVALAMAEAVANPLREDWEGFGISTHGKALICQADTPRSIWRNRMEKLEAAGFDFSNVGTADMGTMPWPMNILDPGAFQKFQAAVRRINPVLVVVDTLRRAFKGNENDSDIMSSVVQLLQAACQPATLLILSHSKKLQEVKGRETDDDAGIIDGARGSGALPGAMDMVIQLTEHSLAFRGRTERSARIPVQHDALGCVRLVQEGLKQHDPYLKTLLVQHPERSASAWAAALNGKDPLVGSYSISTLRQHLATLLKGSR